MPAVKRQKVSNTRIASSSHITAFTKVTKSHSTSRPVYKQVASLDSVFPSGNKRKLVEEIVLDPSESQSSASTINISHRVIKSLPQRGPLRPLQSPHTPINPIVSSTTNPPPETPTKGARALLDLFCIAKTPIANTFSSPLPAELSESSQFQLSGENLTAKPVDSLPLELLDVVSLNSAFLTALSLHYAHNGTHTPADLRLLCPNVARAWGKRKVSLEDIRRILSILNGTLKDGNEDEALAVLNLSDYGNGKICVEISARTGRFGRMARPLDENRTNANFVRNLRLLWDNNESTEIPSAMNFVQTLALEPITTCSSLSKMSPLLAKGQRRLEDLKAGIVIRKEAEEAKKKPAAKEQIGTRPTLLERLRIKQLEKASLPQPPSKEQLARTQALHRLEEVVAVLSLLTTSTSIGQSRVSFTMPTLLGKLRDSFKTPMSKEEGETCVRLLASDIAPEWLKVVRMGNLDAIVVNRENRPSDLDIGNRIRHATTIQDFA